MKILVDLRGTFKIVLYARNNTLERFSSELGLMPDIQSHLHIRAEPEIRPLFWSSSHIALSNEDSS